MTTRACSNCGSRVPNERLRCFHCKQLLPSMLQAARSPAAPALQRPPSKASKATRPGPLARLKQVLAWK